MAEWIISEQKKNEEYKPEHIQMREDWFKENKPYVHPVKNVEDYTTTLRYRFKD